MLLEILIPHPLCFKPSPQFLPGMDTAAVRQGLSQKIHLAILDGVDPSLNNLCAAGLMATKVCALVVCSCCVLLLCALLQWVATSRWRLHVREAVHVWRVSAMTWAAQSAEDVCAAVKYSILYYCCRPALHLPQTAAAAA